MEHRAVAFDVYKAAVDDEALRLQTMRQVTVIFLVINAVRTAILLHATGRLLDLRAIAKGTRMLWAEPGIFRKIIPQYLADFRPDFHPSEHDNDAHVARAKERYLG